MIEKVGIRCYTPGALLENFGIDPERFERREGQGASRLVGLDARLNARLDGQRNDLGGRIEVETSLRYDVERGAFFLV